LRATLKTDLSKKFRETTTTTTITTTTTTTLSRSQTTLEEFYKEPF